MAKVMFALSWSVLLLALVAVHLPPRATAAFPASTTAIPTSCYNPSGSDCKWYKTCLEAKIPCRGGSSDYAVAYGDFYCNKFQQRRSSFSRQGQQWIDGARKCLQEKLAPELRSRNPTCSSIKTKATDNHGPCYVNPPRAPSICDLPLSDWAKIVGLDYSFFKEMKNSMKIRGTCLSTIFSKVTLVRS